MRLWTLHPRYLDSRGLVALWREGLLAQKALRGETRGYRRHPQLLRFAECPDSAAAIGAYLAAVADEADDRGYAFDRSRIAKTDGCERLEATTGQVFFEWMHLMGKLTVRAPAVAADRRSVAFPDPHPLFRLVDGPKSAWERG